MNFKLFQMNVKCFKMNLFIKEKANAAQYPNFEHENFPNNVFKLKKALYDLKRAPNVC